MVINYEIKTYHAVSEIASENNRGHWAVLKKNQMVYETYKLIINAKNNGRNYDWVNCFVTRGCR